MKTIISGSKRRSWAVLLAALAALSILFGITAASGEGARVLLAFRHINGYWLLPAALCQCAVYACVGAIIASGLSGNARKPDAPYLLYVAFAFLFANRALPGPAIAGLAVLTWLLGKRGIAVSMAHAAAAVFYLADYVSFFVLGAIALYSLAPHLPLPLQRIIAVAGSLILAGLIAVTIFTIALSRNNGAVKPKSDRGEAEACKGQSAGKVANEERGHTISGLRKRWPRWTERPGISKSIIRIQGAWTGFIEQWQKISARPGPIGIACIAGLFMHSFEAATLMCAARAFGSPIDFTTTAAAYVAANLAAIVSFLPGGAGFFEGAMIATMCYGAKMPVAAAVATAALYRLLSIWLPAPSLLGLISQAQEGLTAEVDNTHG